MAVQGKNGALRQMRRRTVAGERTLTGVSDGAGRRELLERETRFELATSTLARLHSTTELFPLVEAMRWVFSRSGRRSQMKKSSPATLSLPSAETVGEPLQAAADVGGVEVAVAEEELVLVGFGVDGVGGHRIETDPASLHGGEELA